DLAVLAVGQATLDRLELILSATQRGPKALELIIDRVALDVGPRNVDLAAIDHVGRPNPEPRADRRPPTLDGLAHGLEASGLRGLGRLARLRGRGLITIVGGHRWREGSRRSQVRCAPSPAQPHARRPGNPPPHHSEGSAHETPAPRNAEPPTRPCPRSSDLSEAAADELGEGDVGLV